MKRDFSLDIRHLTRVEGHANIQITVRDGELVDARWAIVETPRFFELMLKVMSAETEKSDDIQVVVFSLFVAKQPP